MITAEALNRVGQFEGDGLPVVSLYVPVDPGASHEELHSRVESLVDQLDDMAKEHSLPHEQRLSLRSDIQRIKDRLGEESWQPQAMAIFSCSGRDLYEEIRLPRRVHDKIVTDENPYVRPMLAVLDEYPRTCIVVVDKASARAWELYQDELSELPKFSRRLLGKASYAPGGEEQRSRNKADELTKQHYRQVVQVLDELFRVGGFDLLVIGGHEAELPVFQQFLTHELRDRVAGSFTFDPDAAQLAEIRTSASAVLQKFERDQDREAVTQVTDVAAAGGLATTGLQACLWAGSVAAIQKLLMQADTTAPGVVCDESGWLGLTGDICPLCGKPTRRVEDVIDELVRAVIDEGGSIRHVETDTQLKDHTVAASLRFPLPPQS